MEVKSRYSVNMAVSIGKGNKLNPRWGILDVLSREFLSNFCSMWECILNDIYVEVIRTVV